MASELVADYSPLLRVYKDGRIERLMGETIVAPSLTPQNGVVSKDTLYSPKHNLSVRLYLPHKFIETEKKLPLLVYFHGGGFLIETAFSPSYHNFLMSAVAITDCVVVSVDYRRAPENPIPIPYEDSWEALKWIFTHFNGSGQENWINKHADFTKVYLSGDSAGANIAHHMAMKAGKEKLTSELNDSGILGIILIHPYFWSKTPIDELDSTDLELRMKIEGIWEISSPNSENGADDPLLNVVGSDSSDLKSLGCRRVLVMVAEKDALVRQGWGYATKVEKSGWKGEMKVILSKNEEHVFHLMRPDCENAREVFNSFSSFITEFA